MVASQKALDACGELDLRQRDVFGEKRKAGPGEAPAAGEEAGLWQVVQERASLLQPHGLK